MYLQKLRHGIQSITNTTFATVAFLHRVGKRRDDGSIVDLCRIVGQIANTRHVAAVHRRDDECLRLLVGRGLNPACQAANGEVQNRACWSLPFSRQQRFVTELGKMPVCRRRDRDGFHAHCAIGEVCDLAVRRGDNRTLVGHGEGQRGGNGNIQFGRRNIAVVTARQCRRSWWSGSPALCRNRRRCRSPLALAQTASDSIMPKREAREMSLLQFHFIAIIQKLLSKIR